MNAKPFKFIRSLAVLIVFIAFGTAAGQNSGAVTELDPAVWVAYDVSERIRLDFIVGRENSEELSSSKGKISAGISFRTKPFLKLFLDALDTDKRHVLVLSTFYEYARASEKGETKNEHKIMLDATVRWSFKPKLLLSNRNRFENKWINGEYHFRIREWFVLEYPFKFMKRKISPFVEGEAFWDQRYRQWNIFKYGAGVQIPIFRRTSVTLYYERRHCVTCPDPHTNIYGVNMNVYLKRKK